MKASWILVAILVTCCAKVPAQTTERGPEQVDATQAHKSSGPDASSLVQDRHPRYKLMPLDVLAISFPLSPEINQSVTVQPDGYITLANVGSIYVQGETVPQLIGTLTQAYAKILHNPIIAVDLTNFQRPQFVVTGQVDRPGRYELRPDTTVSEGIAIGGGLTGSAKSQVFVLHRISSDWMEVKKLDVKKVLTGKNMSEDIHLQPGDLIFVPDKFIARFRRYVPYTGPGFGTGLGFSGTSLLNGN
ncbi:MAG TPA: polysaccharide biosynthesis/export family protein [Terriglobales bacterium]|nr:polysaccharide biosynthesis/export family protein [Terriglobales bacterium]